jgi:hypothetical protein
MAPHKPPTNPHTVDRQISSALSHPSIMATYTYDIRAVCDSTGSGANGDAGPDASATGAADAAASTMTSLAALRLVGGTAQNAHSFEVRDGREPERNGHLMRRRRRGLQCSR